MCVGACVLGGDSAAARVLPDAHMIESSLATTRSLGRHPHHPLRPRPYSQAVVANGFAFVSGQIPLTADGKLKAGNIKEQTVCSRALPLEMWSPKSSAPLHKKKKTGPCSAEPERGAEGCGREPQHCRQDHRLPQGHERLCRHERGLWAMERRVSGERAARALSCIPDISPCFHRDRLFRVDDSTQVYAEVRCRGWHRRLGTPHPQKPHPEHP